MLTFIVWIVLVVISYWILYLVIKAAIDNSSVFSMFNEMSSIRNRSKSEYEELKNQVQKLVQLTYEQNQLIRSLQEKKDK